MRLILADAGLRGAGGHHLGYTLALGDAAAERGVAALVFTHRDFTGSLGTARAEPVFEARYQTTGTGSPLHRALFGTVARLPPRLAVTSAALLRRTRRAARAGRADSFGAELAAALAAHHPSPEDTLLLPSVSAANLAGLAEALPADMVGRVAVVLRRLPDEMEQTDPGPAPIAAILHDLHAHFGATLHLFADTVPLAELWRGHAGLPVTPVPLPIVVPAVAEHPPHAPPHLVFAGGARAEKGYGLLPALAARLAGSARFTIHSGPVGPGSDPTVQQAQRRLRALAGPGPRLIEQALDPDAYLALIASADMLLLPYDPTAYGPRSSGILAEARALGIPAIVSRGCWMEAEAGPARGYAFDYPGGLADSVERALAALQPLTAAMRAEAAAWRHTHNPAALLDTVLGAGQGL